MNTCRHCGAIFVTEHQCTAVNMQLKWRMEELNEYQSKKRPLQPDESKRVALLKKEINQLQSMQ